MNVFGGERDRLGVPKALRRAITGHSRVHEEERPGADDDAVRRRGALRLEERGEVIEAAELILGAPARLERAGDVAQHIEANSGLRGGGVIDDRGGSGGVAALTRGEAARGGEGEA